MSIFFNVSIFSVCFDVLLAFLGIIEPVSITLLGFKSVNESNSSIKNFWSGDFFENFGLFAFSFDLEMFKFSFPALSPFIIHNANFRSFMDHSAQKPIHVDILNEFS